MGDLEDGIDHTQHCSTHRIQNAWRQYLQIGTSLSIVGGIGLWIWFMILWGLWGLFLGWIPAALIGWFLLRFIWLPVLLACLWLLFYALPQEMQVLTVKALIFGTIFTVILSKARKKKNDES